ncbi:expressed unknown protein [Seminavis robusta]|uniref:BTB domain-containing protein n=1 Tax=Seminavis robusta TaxID=568900 RepID=A0A9N8H635_9STRA|nr:expressed unknown protein [Seminavis robusta]|eukprot:Sro89_g046850.1 n/a (466) ;mRNA; f:39203-40600
MSEVPSDKLELPHCEEITRDAGIASFLTDDALCDLTLIGNDGDTVHANRFLLASRSKVFHSMLLGKFAEAQKDEIPLDYRGCVLKSLVEYIVTDSTGLLENSAKDTPIDEAQAEVLASQMAAAMFFELPGLCQKVFALVNQTLCKHPTSAFAILEACQKEGPAIPAQLKVVVISRLVANINVLDNSAVSVLSVESLKDILKCDTTEVDEFCLFELLQLWVEGKKNASDDSTTSGSESPKNIASQLVKKHIRMDWIDPELLFTSVQSSGFVPQELLLAAFHKQAVRIKRQHNNVVFKQARNLVVWKNSLTNVSSSPANATAFCNASDMLQYPPIVCGKHEWTLELVEESKGDWVGIAFQNIDLSKWLGEQKGGWGLCRDGRACHNAAKHSEGHPRYTKGSKITFTINLSPNEESNGTLHAQIDDDEKFLVFENLREELQGSNGGFVPAVSNYPQGNFRLVRIEKLG